MSLWLLRFNFLPLVAKKPCAGSAGNPNQHDGSADHVSMPLRGSNLFRIEYKERNERAHRGTQTEDDCESQTYPKHSKAQANKGHADSPTQTEPNDCHKG